MGNCICYLYYTVCFIYYKAFTHGGLSLVVYPADSEAFCNPTACCRVNSFLQRGNHYKKQPEVVAFACLSEIELDVQIS